MNEYDGPVYEVTLSIDREVAHDVDVWLASHVDEMLEVSGIVSARSYALEDDGDRVRRVSSYYFESDAHLEQYLAGPAKRLRQSAIDKFGDRFDASRRILRDLESAGQQSAPIQHCLNCDAALTGQYCGNCGQRASSRLISIWELVRDAFGDLFELDSRIWRTLIPLAVRPGLLTRDYLNGRRARYMPPFRMYIVLSLAFFLIAFFDPREDLGILFEPEAPESSENPNIAEQAAAELRAELGEQAPTADEPDTDDGLSLTIDGDSLGDDCEFEDFDSSEMPPWLARRLTRERLQLMCERLIAEDGQGMQGFADKLGENVPIGLFILLPMMALVLKILYPLSKRYYVEHLLFVVHYHAFIFLAISIQILLSRFSALINMPDPVDEFMGLVISLYIPIYLYKALRRVYLQSRFVTLLKLIALILAYIMGMILILGIAAVFAAFSI